MGYSTKAKKISGYLTHLFDKQITVTSASVELAHNIMGRSDEAAKIVIPYANHIINKISLKSAVAASETSCKKLMRIFEKAHGKFEGDVSKVPDVGRMRILIEKPEDIIALRKLYLGNNPRYTKDRIGVLKNQHPSNYIKVIEFEDFYHLPSSTGRMGIHIGLEVKVPGKETVKVEIQVLHKDMVNTEDFTRDNYMNAQLIRRTAKAENRVLTTDELTTIECYDSSSRERYTAEGIQYDLIGLRRSDLVIEYNTQQKAEQVKRLKAHHARPRGHELAIA